MLISPVDCNSFSVTLAHFGWIKIVSFVFSGQYFVKSLAP
ncbi:hypothetical protein SynA1562_01751 [Synechococcus sp. A15-62]|nr:hypothetical protein SynA1562_01751 [Synechococcus sp. A15-62]